MVNNLAFSDLPMISCALLESQVEKGAPGYETDERVL